ncbi:oleosin 18.2 kDa-like [Mercurialis annua]|uniref:oleosin 18.2 kDa-like n=1 Tax=Mercurialis annua TaxID=3986 RepID=UPI00215FBAA7|nr:oleosin 18.2 kDa-like [Mercurialis annua]
MADRAQPHQVQVHRYEPGYKAQQKGPSASKVLAVMTLLPIGGGLLGLSGMTLAGTLIGLAVTTPVFIIFSPVIVPAAIVVGLAMMAFMASGAFGLTGATSVSWVLKYIREATRTMPESLDQAKRRMQDMAGYVGQKTKEVGQEIQRKAHEGK